MKKLLKGLFIYLILLGIVLGTTITWKGWRGDNFAVPGYVIVGDSVLATFCMIDDSAFVDTLESNFINVDNIAVDSLNVDSLEANWAEITKLTDGTATLEGGALGGITTIGMSGQLTSTLADGTKPFVITSTTLNTNLNADLLDSKSEAAFATLAEAETVAGKYTFSDTLIASKAVKGGDGVILSNETALKTGLPSDKSWAYPYDDGSNIHDVFTYDNAGTEANRFRASTQDVLNAGVGRTLWLTTDDYVEVADDADIDFGTGDFAIRMLDVIPYDVSGTEYLISKMLGDTLGYGLYMTDNDLYIYLDDNTTIISSIIGTDVFTAGVAHDIFVNFDRSGNATAFIGGRKVGTVAISSANLTISNATVLRVGCTTTGASFFAGELGEWNVFNSVYDETSAVDLAIIEGGAVPFKYQGAKVIKHATFDANMDGFSNISAESAFNTDHLALSFNNDVGGECTYYGGFSVVKNKIYRFTFDLANLNNIVRLKLVQTADPSGAGPGGSPSYSGDWINFYFDNATLTNGSYTFIFECGETDNLFFVFYGASTSPIVDSGDLDNWFLDQIGCVGDYPSYAISATGWGDASGNGNDGTHNATPVNPLASAYYHNAEADATGIPIEFYKESASPADNDVIAIIPHYANDSGGTKTEMVRETTYSSDVTNTDEAGRWNVSAIMDGTLRSLIDADAYGQGVVNQGEVTINEDAQDVDFRVEGVGAANALFVQGSDGNVGIGTTAPSSKLHVYNGAGTQALFSGWADIRGTTDEVVSGQITIGGTAAYRGNIQYNGIAGVLYIDNTYNNNSGDIHFRTKTDGTPINAMTIKGDGNVGIGTSTPSHPLTVANISGFAVKGRTQSAATDSSWTVTIASGEPTMTWNASDGDQGTIAINTSDALNFAGFTGGVDVDGAATATSFTADADVTGATVASITAANLLDKSATESISGVYTFTNIGGALVVNDSAFVDTLTSTVGKFTKLSSTGYGSDNTVSDAELLYINSLSSNAQDQLNLKAPSANPTFTGLVKRSVTATITAVSPGGQGDGALTTDINEISICGTASDAVTLPIAVAGLEIFIINNGAQILEIWPATGDDLGAGVNTATTLAAGANITFCSYNSTNWEIK